MDNCKKCGRLMHKFHDCVLNPVAVVGSRKPFRSIDDHARTLLVDSIVHEALRGVEFDLDPVDLLREAVERVNGDAMVIVNRMPEAV